MKIDSTLTASATTELRGLPLRTGQTLAAIVLQANQGTGKALLSLAGGQVTVTTQLPLTTGSAIQLKVKDAGPPVVMGLLSSAQETMTTKTTVQSAVQTLLTLLMTRLSANTNAATASAPLKSEIGPAQGSQTQTTTTANATPTTQAGNMTTAVASPPIKLDLPLNVRTALLNLDEVLSALRTGQPVTNQTLAQNITQLIVANSLPPAPSSASLDQATSDIKSQLKLAAQQLKMQASLESMGNNQVATARGVRSAASASQAQTQTVAQTSAQTVAQNPGQTASLQSSIEQWIGRLDVSQLRTALLQIQGQPTWVVDVPMMLAEQPRRVQIAIQEQAQNTNPPTESTWQLDFAIDLPALGPLHGSLSLQSTDLTVRLYADKPEARMQLDASLDQLAEHLRAASLTPKELRIYPGPPPKAVQERLSPAPFLDEHATFRCRV